MNKTDSHTDLLEAREASAAREAARAATKQHRQVWWEWYQSQSTEQLAQHYKSTHQAYYNKNKHYSTELLKYIQPNSKGDSKDV